MRRPCGPVPASLLAVTLIGCSDFFLSRKQPEVNDGMGVMETFQQSPLPQVDLLWVIDDTPSMADEHDTLAAAMPAFADELDEAGIAWQVGVVTTDPGEDIGVLRGDPWILTPTEGDSLRTLLETANVNLLGREPAAGLASMVLALEDPLRSAENQGFRRPGAALQVIVVSDGDDRSDDLLGGDPVATALDLLESETARTGRPARLSAIVGPPEGCSGPGGTALPGVRYLEVAESTGGATGSVCEGHFVDLVSSVGAASVEWQTEFPLQASPVPASVRVSIDGRRRDEGWTVETAPPRVRFDSPPAPGSEIIVRYDVEDG